MSKVNSEKTPEFYMDHMYFDKIAFKRLHTLNPLCMDPPDVRVSHAIYHVKDMTYLVRLTLEALKKDEYEATVTVVGQFTIDDGADEEDIEYLINRSAISILFPYVRERLTGLTCQPYTVPYIIPPTNVNACVDFIPLKMIPEVCDINNQFSTFFALNHIPNGLSDDELGLRDKIVQHIFSAKQDMEIRESDGNIILHEKDYKELAKTISDEYYTSKALTRCADDDPYSDASITDIMQSLKIPVVFARDLINDLVDKVLGEPRNDIQYLVLINRGEIYE